MFFKQKSDGTYFYDMLVVVKCKDNDLFFQIFLATSLTTINIITFDIFNKKVSLNKQKIKLQLKRL